MALTTTLSSRRNGAKTTSRIGLGTATLMREPSARVRRSVLETAYGVGVRHFDTAPLYGLGRAEVELGSFLKTTVGDSTVATKFGLRPTGVAQLVSRVQRPIRAVLRRSDRLRRLARQSGGLTAATQPTPTIESVRLGLERSLRALQIDTLDVLLMHDLEWSSATAAFLSELANDDTLPADTVGIAGDIPLLTTYDRAIVDEFAVVQTTGPFDGLNPSTRIIQYGALSQRRQQADAALSRDDVLRASLEDLVGHRLRTGEELAGLVACLALAAIPDSIVLVGTTNPRHIESLWAATQRDLESLQQNPQTWRKLA